MGLYMIYKMKTGIRYFIIYLYASWIVLAAVTAFEEPIFSSFFFGGLSDDNGLPDIYADLSRHETRPGCKSCVIALFPRERRVFLYWTKRLTVAEKRQEIYNTY